MPCCDSGAKILLNNAVLNLKRGKRYGLCGPNGCGKSTLMRSIANGQVKEFPPQDELKTVYVEHDIDAEETEQPVINFICSDKELKSKSLPLLKVGANPSPILKELVSIKTATAISCHPVHLQSESSYAVNLWLSLGCPITKIWIHAIDISFQAFLMGKGRFLQPMTSCQANELTAALLCM